MKKMKKILAFVLAMAMVLGMSVTAFATGDGTGDGDGAGGNGGSSGTTQSTTSVDITGKPTSENKAPVIIQNVEAGATVTAYRIVVPIYDPDSAVGFKGYESLKVVQSAGAESSAIVANPLKPTAKEVTDIASNSNLLQKITESGSPAGVNVVGMNTAVTSDAPNGFVQGTVKTTGAANEKGKADYTAQLGAGYWLVLITGTDEDVYNPMLVGVYYSAKNGTQNTLEGAELNSNSQFTINGSEVYAKSTKPSIDKKIVDADGKDLTKFDVADKKTVYFQIDTVIPSYSEEYEKAVVKIKDELSDGLELNQSSIVVKVNGSEVSATEGTNKTYTITKTESGFEIVFDEEYILSTEGRKNFRNVVVTYNATLYATKAGINFDPNTNKATLTYTNKPDVDGTTTTKEDTTYSYTFGIDVRPYGEDTSTWNTITKELIKGQLVSETVNGTTTTNFVPLNGAEFTLTNTETNQVYTATSKAEVVGKNPDDTDMTEDGFLSFRGLAEGSYILKETKAPSGYSINTKEYAVNIAANYDGDGLLTDYTITIDDVVTKYTASYNGTKVTGVSTTSKKGSGAETTTIITTEIPNTKLTDLPSTGGIGTTIFTIGGCAIMIIAAGLFFASRRKSSK